MGFYGIDIYYLVLILPAIAFALFAQARVKTTFQKFSSVRTVRGMTGAQAAQAILRANGIVNVRVERVSGNLTDHFDPRNNVIRLSDGVHDSTSVASVGVAAHEAGHAVQYAEGYGPIKLRAAIIPVTQIGSTLAMPLFIIGLIFSFPLLMNIGIIFFGLSTVFQLITLPVEFNASSRALSALESSGMLYGEENEQAKAVLSAAALTYVAALAVSLAQLLRLIALSNRRRR